MASIPVDKNRDYTKGDVVLDGSRFVTITGERCWQCRKVSVGTYRVGKGKKTTECETCVHGCGPRGLSKLFQF